MFGRGRYHRLAKGALLMWIERDEFGENWFMELGDKQRIVSVKGAALQNIVSVPPEEAKK